MPIPPCPRTIPELDAELTQLGVLWRDSELRPKATPKMLRAWDNLIAAWASDKNLPLLIRKKGRDNGRGAVVFHSSGRPIVPTDNSPANWSLTLALDNECPTLEDIRRLFDEDKIPIAVALNESERKSAKYKCTRSEAANLNQLGYKVCHRRPVGLNDRRSIADIEQETLEKHFRVFLAPSNMFVVPKAMEGLGEIPQIVAAMGDYP